MGARAGRSRGRAAAGTARSRTTWRWCAPPADLTRSGRAPRRPVGQVPSAAARRAVPRRRVPPHDSARSPSAWGAGPLPLEKDFSPTLAGDALADERARILRWLREVPARIRARGRPAPVRLALKLMNARFDDAFQLEMLAAAAGGATRSSCSTGSGIRRPASPTAAGDLSDRNLRVLAAARRRGCRVPPLVGTGNVCSGRLLLDYARLGCESVQLHTFFQLPLREYPGDRRQPAAARAARAPLRSRGRADRGHARSRGGGRARTARAASCVPRPRAAHDASAERADAHRPASSSTS